MRNNLASRIYWYIRYILAKAIARKLSRARLENLKPKKLLVMCYGNIYRSPFVAEYLIAKLGNNSKFEIKLAGFFQSQGENQQKSTLILYRNMK